MFDKCLCQLCFQPQGSLTNTSALIYFQELAAKENKKKMQDQTKGKQSQSETGLGEVEFLLAEWKI